MRPDMQTSQGCQCRTTQSIPIGGISESALQSKDVYIVQWAGTGPLGPLQPRTTLLPHPLVRLQLSLGDLFRFFQDADHPTSVPWHAPLEE